MTVVITSLAVVMASLRIQPARMRMGLRGHEAGQTYYRQTSHIFPLLEDELPEKLKESTLSRSASDPVSMADSNRRLVDRPLDKRRASHRRFVHSVLGHQLAHQVECPADMCLDGGGNAAGTTERPDFPQIILGS